METIYQHPAYTELPIKEAAMPKAPTQEIPTEYCVQPDTRNVWIFDVPPANLMNRKILLLTIMGIGVHAIWQGNLGTHYTGYSA